MTRIGSPFRSLAFALARLALVTISLGATNGGDFPFRIGLM